MTVTTHVDSNDAPNDRFPWSRSLLIFLTLPTSLSSPRCVPTPARPPTRENKLPSGITGLPRKIGTIVSEKKVSQASKNNHCLHSSNGLRDIVKMMHLSGQALNDQGADSTNLAACPPFSSQIV